MAEQQSSPPYASPGSDRYPNPNPGPVPQNRDDFYKSTGQATPNQPFPDVDPNKNPPSSKPPEEDARDLHPAVAEAQPFRGSGKETSQVKPPIVSVARSSGETYDGKPFIVDDAAEFVFHNEIDDMQFAELKHGQAMFMPTQPNKTTDELVERMYKAVHNAKVRYSSVERDENGDEILDMTCVKERKRNEDGTIQMENGKPIVGANFTQEPKYVSARNFIVKAVAKGDKLSDNKEAPGDGVLIIRIV